MYLLVILVLIVYDYWLSSLFPDSRVQNALFQYSVTLNKFVINLDKNLNQFYHRLKVCFLIFNSFNLFSIFVWITNFFISLNAPNNLLKGSSLPIKWVFDSVASPYISRVWVPLRNNNYRSIKYLKSMIRYVLEHKQEHWTHRKALGVFLDLLNHPLWPESLCLQLFKKKY